MVDILLPLKTRISLSVLAIRSTPLNLTSPPTILPGGQGTSFRTDWVAADLPEPDSPTKLRVSPWLKEKDTPSTALTTPRKVSK